MKRVLLIAAVLCVAVSSFALFRASDIVYVLAAANAPGAGGTQWQTDVWVTNPGLVDLKLTIEYLPTGAAGNPTPFDDSSRFHIDWPTTIAPRATLFIPNIVSVIKQTYPNVAVAGAFIFYGEQATGDILSLVVNSRTYTPKDPSDLSQGYFGQDIPGTPWFYYIDSNFASSGLDAYWLVGLTDNTAFRTNVGIVNGSQGCILDVKFELYDATGTKVGEVTKTGIGALAQVQYAQMLINDFGLAAGVALDYSLRVSIAKSTAVDSTHTCTPALYTYASKVDNKTGDPNYVEATYFMTSTATDSVILCIWP